jgi:hypothetical protein
VLDTKKHEFPKVAPTRDKDLKVVLMKRASPRKIAVSSIAGPLNMHPSNQLVLANMVPSIVTEPLKRA